MRKRVNVPCMKGTLSLSPSQRNMGRRRGGGEVEEEKEEEEELGMGRDSF